MFVLDFKNWLETCGEDDPPAKKTNVSLGIPSKIETGGEKDRRRLINPFTNNIRRDRRYGKSTTNHRI